MTETGETGTATFENLDLLCAKAGQEIAAAGQKELEKRVTEALAVLEEQGVYAMFLYLKARGGDEGRNIFQNLFNFLKNTPSQSPMLSSEKTDVLEAVREDWATDLDKLLFARDLIRQALVYARYHAKAAKKDETRGAS
jgi:hypothetical protein